MLKIPLCWPLVCAILLGLTQAALAQEPAWQTPRTPKGKPDFSGFWSQPRQPTPPPGGGATTFTKQNFADFVAGGEAQFYKRHTGNPLLDEPRAYCMPSGFPSAYFGPYPVQMVQTDDWLVMVTEYERATRLIPLDGRAHRDDIEPTFYGLFTG